MDLSDRFSQFMHIRQPSAHTKEVNRETAPVSETSSTENKSLKTDSVEISPQGQEKLATNQKIDLGNELHKEQQLRATDPKEELESIDKMIEELKQQIRELMQQMKNLEAKGDETSMEQMKLLQAQIVSINAQLMDLNNRKLMMIEGQGA